MSRYQARRAMYASRQFDHDVPQNSSPSINPLAKSDTTGIGHSYYTGKPQARARRGNDSCSWALWGVLLVAVFVYIIPHVNPDFNAHVVDTVTPGRAAIKADVTLAVHDHINSLIDLYAPFLDSSTPLLRLGARELYRASGEFGETPWLGGPEDNLKAWNLLLTGKVFDEIYWSDALKDDRDNDLKPYFQINTEFEKDLARAQEKQTGVAHSLASPNTTDLWAHRIRAEFVQLFSDLHKISIESKLKQRSMDENLAWSPAAAEAAESEGKQRTAEALYRHVDEGGPWQFINQEIRSNLSMLRQDCVSFPQYLDRVHWSYNKKVFGFQPDSWPQPRQGQPELIPVAHAESLVSAIDDYIAALDAVDQGFLRLRTLLDEQRRAGWEAVEEIKYSVRVRAQFRLPPPEAIQESVSARLERLMAKASRKQETFSHIRAAEESLVHCMKDGGKVPMLGRMHICLQMGAFPPYTYTEQIAFAVTHVTVRIFYAAKKATELFKFW